MQTNIDGVVLCGGKATRMGGIEKGLLDFKGKPLFVYSAEKLSPRVNTLWISANRSLEKYGCYGWPVVKDSMENCGPLGGIYTVLKQMNASFLLTVPCDCPFFEERFDVALKEKLFSSSSTVAYVWDGTRDQYLFALFKKSVLAQLEKYLVEGERKVARFYQFVQALKVDLSQYSESFYNINYLVDLEEAVRKR
ncbi:molybdenum cofactor guanylyltransferase MobA [Methylacidiphilum caldifontis]|uniref:Probable molybdenum cofactor guanylyltransferase n=1 Tax=Methylacidiphilum caldifontis TaxID=2795386 RepID=A0A4Y8P9J5_9BACT|nr:molybdenum cofactor guanylyltransferase MobA [Methylacidiphilum caldifontis]TFE67397.1 molybdenum cofactor guanylyltransferase [Methylacidiphilum caldifontis]